MKAIEQYVPVVIIDKVDLTFASVDPNEIMKCEWPFKWKLLTSTFLWYYLLL